MVSILSGEVHKPLNAALKMGVGQTPARQAITYVAASR